MDTKKTVMLGMVVGSTIGGLVPMLWGAGMFDFSSVIFTGAGGVLGIWLGFKLANW